MKKSSIFDHSTLCESEYAGGFLFIFPVFELDTGKYAPGKKLLNRIKSHKETPSEVLR